MKKGVLLIGTVSVVLFVLFLGGCDNGVYAPNPDTKLRVFIEREVRNDLNVGLRIWAQEVRRDTKLGKDVLTFVCPCYLGEPVNRSPIVAIPEEQLILEVLSGATYSITVIENKN